MYLSSKSNSSPVPAFVRVDAGNAGLISSALALVPPDSLHAGRLLSTYSLILYKETGDYEGARNAFHRALAIAQREQDPALEMRILAGAAEAAGWHLSLTEVVEYGRRAVGLSDQIDDLRSEIQARIQMGRALAAMGESQKARLDSSTLITTAERLRDWLSLRDTAWRKAEDCSLRGEWEDARAYVGSVPENLALLTTLAMVEQGNRVLTKEHLE